MTVLESQDRGFSRWVEIDVGLDQLTEMVRSRAPNPLRIIERVHAHNDPRGKVPGSGPVFLVWLITPPPQKFCLKFDSAVVLDGAGSC